MGSILRLFVRNFLSRKNFVKKGLDNIVVMDFVVKLKTIQLI